MTEPIQKRTLREEAWHFFEDSQTPAAIAFRFFIAALILLSASLAVITLFYEERFAEYLNLLGYVEHFILWVFTAEFTIRFLVSPSKTRFAKDGYNLIDFLAIAPFFLGIENAILLRILRLFRLFRFFRLIKRGRMLDVFTFKNTIVQAVSPVVITLMILKGIFWFFESKDLWIVETDLSTLFTIIGFALGVVLSQKIGTTYAKYLEIQSSMFKLHGELNSLESNLNIVAGNTGVRLVQRWLDRFMEIYHGPDENGVRSLRHINAELHRGVAKIGNTELIPFHRMAAFLREIFVSSVSILSKKVSYVPPAYDRLLQQTTLIYLVLLTIFIPGIIGMISVVLASYLLYGMYYLTRDLDLSVGREKGSLVQIEVRRIENYLADITREVGARVK